MKQRALLFCKYLLFWMLYFSIARVLFMTYQRKFADIAGAMLHGWSMDLSMTGYIMMLAALILAAIWPLGAKWHTKIFDWITLALIIPATIVVVADMELYRHWGFRIDSTVLMYLRTPKMAMASTPLSTALLLILLCIATVIGAFKLYKLLCNNHLKNIEPYRWWCMPIFIVLAGCMILPIRGSLGVATMNPGKVYFSKNMYSNHAALNALWNMIYSCSTTDEVDIRYPDTATPEEAASGYASLMQASPDSAQHLLRIARPNVVLLLLESFTAKAVGFCGGIEGITPNLDTMAAQGIAYTNIYAAGNRSDKGIVATLSGLPAQPENSIIKYHNKTAYLPSIGKSLHQHGYHNTFYYGGDPTFAHIQGFIYQCQFERIVALHDFPPEQRNSKWGAHDEYVLDRLLTEMDTAKGPFFKMLFTLTSHEPFELPRQPQGYLSRCSDVELLLNSIHYTDSCLGVFMEQARQRSWWDSTLFVLIADHGHPLPYDDYGHPARLYHIPMVWVGGALAYKPHQQRKVGSQFDLAATLLTQLGIDASEFVLSKDINNPTTAEFAYYAFNKGYGFVSPTDTVIFDLTSQRHIHARSDSLSRAAAAFFRCYQDYFEQLGQ